MMYGRKQLIRCMHSSCVWTGPPVPLYWTPVQMVGNGIGGWVSDSRVVPSAPIVGALCDCTMGLPLDVVCHSRVVPSAPIAGALCGGTMG